MANGAEQTRNSSIAVDFSPVNVGVSSNDQTILEESSVTARVGSLLPKASVYNPTISSRQPTVSSHGPLRELQVAANGDTSLAVGAGRLDISKGDEIEGERLPT